MSYAGIDCSFPWHPNIAGLSDSEYRIHSTAIIYANAHLTDGVITRAAVKSFPGYKARTVKTLEERGLWVPHDDGWSIRNYMKWNFSAEETERMKEAKRRAGRAGAAARWGSE